jgi:hypothetical protein
MNSLLVGRDLVDPTDKQHTHTVAACHRNLKGIFKFIYVAFFLFIQFESMSILNSHKIA